MVLVSVIVVVIVYAVTPLHYLVTTFVSNVIISNIISSRTTVNKIIFHDNALS